MSYILDALKKADAEREREGVPSLHTQHGHAADTSDRGGQRPVSATVGLQWAVGGVAAGLVLLAGVWWLKDQPESPGASAPEANGTQRPSALASAPIQAPPVPAPAPVAPVATTPQAVPPVAALAAVAEAPGGSTTEPARRTAPNRAEASTSRSASALHVDASLRDAPRRVVPVAELPEDVRRELPALSIGGAMHSDVPANRMLVLNGSVFHEGDQPAPGLVLEEIKLKSAVFRFKDHRYSVAY